jgi:UDP-N-acetyl-D-mannosaminuronic acid dehydrogenase
VIGYTDPRSVSILADTHPSDGANTVAVLDLVIVGGCGHVGLPLALSFAEAGCIVGIYDIDTVKIERVRAGRMPFMERGADELLRRVLPTGRLQLSDNAEILRRTDVVVMVIGTPIDEFMNPSTRVFERAVDELGPHLREESLVILRSTVYPGTTEYVGERLDEMGKRADVAFCPERIAEGYALEEIRSLPQLIGAGDDRAFERARAIFSRLDVEIVRTTPRESEVAKLFTNTWRYMRFAIANQFFQMAHSAGLDYDRVLHAIRHNYPRAADLPDPGFAAGPCLLKDTMQLAAFSQDHFPMGHAAMLVNEGLPGYIVAAIEQRRPLRGLTVGILGMAFKGESDDPRTSLSYKMRKLIAFRGARVLATDPYVEDPRLVPLEQVLDEADLLIIGAPHRAYRHLDLASHDVVDVWGVTDHRIRI